MDEDNCFDESFVLEVSGHAGVGELDIDSLLVQNDNQLQQPSIVTVKKQKFGRPRSSVRQHFEIRGKDQKCTCLHCSKVVPNRADSMHIHIKSCAKALKVASESSVASVPRNSHGMEEEAPWSSFVNETCHGDESGSASESTGCFMGKTKVCVICTSRILDHYDDEENLDTLHCDGQPQVRVISSEIFLQGVSVFCDVLKIESKYGDTRAWVGLTGNDNLAKVVCCRVCHGLFENLVKLQELIVSTQATLKQDVHVIQEHVIQSQNTAEEVEYSINTCLRFREDILKRTDSLNFSNAISLDRHLDEPRNSANNSQQLGERHRRRNRKSKSSNGNDPSPKSPTTVKLNPVVVLKRIEKLEIKEDIINNSQQQLSENDCYSDTDNWDTEPTFTNDDNTTSDFPKSSYIEIGSGNDGHADDTEESDFLSTSQDNPTPRKRGRPRKYPKVEKIPGRKRGRPRKETSSPVKSDHVSETDTHTVDVPRARGRPRKQFLGDMDVEMEKGNDTDKDYIPNESDEDEETHWATKRRRILDGSRSLEKRKVGRPLKQDKNIMPEGPKRTPIFVLNASSGHYMFLNSRFEKKPDGLSCLHPNCSFVVTVQSYFMEMADAFKNMSLHIKNFHRNKYNTHELGKDRKKYHYCCHCEIQLTDGKDLLKHKKKLHPGKPHPLTLCEICGDTMDMKQIFQHRRTHSEPLVKPVSGKTPGRPRKYLWAEEDEHDNLEDEGTHRRNRIRSSKAAYSRRRRRLIALGTPDIKLPVGRPLLRDRNALPDGPKLAPIFTLQSSRGIFMFVNVKFEKGPDSIICRHPDCSYSTPIRGYFTDQTAAFQRMRLHIRNFHRNKYKSKALENDGANFHYCCYCEVQLPCGRVLLAHKKDIHCGELPPLAFCEICGDTMDHHLIFRHRYTHKSDEENAKCLTKAPKVPSVSKYSKATPPSKRNYPCNQCPKVFQTKRLQKSHLQSHIPIHLRRKVVCDLCGVFVINEQNLKIHKQTVHFRAELPPAFECRICGKKFLTTEKIRYESHLNVHSGLRPYQCSTCGKGFYSRSNLNIHERTHLNNPAVPCPHCPNTYKKDRYLQRHLAASHPESIASKTFKQESPMENFMGPRLMYPCEPCGKVFQYKSRLVKHLKGKHNWSLEKSEDYPNQYTWEDAVDAEDNQYGMQRKGISSQLILG